MLTGFAHGAAGIAYALLRLFVASGDKAFLRAAWEGIVWEDSVFRRELGMWPDFREADGDPSARGSTWCHGAPGIGLARVGCLAKGAASWSQDERARLEEDIIAAMRAAQAMPRTAVDHLCCGNFGRAEMLLGMSRHRNDEALTEDARRWSWELVLEARHRGGYRYFHDLPANAYTPGLFQGAAGIGYQLLRQAAPGEVPSLLLWE